MGTDASCVSYGRDGSLGTLRLKGVVDIFEAACLREASLQALNDSDALHVQLDMSEASRLDLSGIQILVALKKDLASTGREWPAVAVPARISDQLTAMGLSL